MSASALRRVRSLSTLLSLLVAVPLCMCIALTGASVAARIDDARAANAAANKVQTFSTLQQLQSDLNREIIPALALRIFQVPSLRAAVGVGSRQPRDLGLSDGLLGSIRAATDADIRRLDTIGEDALSRRTRTLVDQMRHDVDSGAGLTFGFQRTVEAVHAMSLRVSSSLTGVVLQSTPELADAIRDATLTSAAGQAGAAELVLLGAYKFPGVGLTDSVAEGRRLWLHGWGNYEAASQDVLDQSSRQVAVSWREALMSGVTAEFERHMQAYATDGTTPLDVNMLVQLYRGSEYRASQFAAINRDVLKRVEAAATGLVSESRSSAWTIGGAVLLALIVSVLVLVVVRRAIARPLGVLAKQAESVSQGELIDVTPHGPREIRTVGIGLASAVDNLRRIEAQALAVSLGEFDSHVVSDPLPGPLGAVMHDSVMTIVDTIHERDAAQRDLAYRATHDVLTELPNRNQALVSIPHALQRARRGGQSTCLMFVDLDYFKAVNDNLGHAAGDVVLKECARRMRRVVRQSDTVFRLGGDEFAVLLEDVSGDFPFLAFAEKLIREVSRPIPVQDAIARVGASVGVSLCQDASVDVDRLLSEADAAAYSAKACGRGRVGFFDDDLRAALSRRAAIERGLEAALCSDGLVLVYQPVVDMRRERPVGFEALVRWHDPERGVVPPADFIPIAEKSQLINRIGRWTLRAALVQLAAWDAAGGIHPGLTMAVNVSGRHLLSPDLLTDVREALCVAGLPATRLVIEVTETMIVDDPVALHNLQQLRALGVRVAIDDFGTGYASIGQLPKLPVDMLKIDRSFTGLVGRGQRELVLLIVKAAHALGLSVVAEGIEGQAQADAMRELAVDGGQGFFYAPPVSAQGAERLGGLARLPEVTDPSRSTERSVVQTGTR